MIQELEKRIDNIIAKLNDGAFEEDIAEANAWKETARRAFLTKGVKSHEGIKMIIDRFISELENINLVLLNANSSKISDRERDRLLDKKELYKDFLSIFPEADQAIEVIDASVAENESHLGLRKE